MSFLVLHVQASQCNGTEICICIKNIIWHKVYNVVKMQLNKSRSSHSSRKGRWWEARGTFGVYQLGGKLTCTQLSTCPYFYTICRKQIIMFAILRYNHMVLSNRLTKLRGMVNTTPSQPSRAAVVIKMTHTVRCWLTYLTELRSLTCLSFILYIVKWEKVWVSVSSMMIFSYTSSCPSVSGQYCTHLTIPSSTMFVIYNR